MVLLLKLLSSKSNCTVNQHIRHSSSVDSWWRHQMETFSALLAFCEGNSPVPGEFLSQRPVTWSFDVFFSTGPITTRSSGSIYTTQLYMINAISFSETRLVIVLLRQLPDQREAMTSLFPIQRYQMTEAVLDFSMKPMHAVYLLSETRLYWLTKWTGVLDTYSRCCLGYLMPVTGWRTAVYFSQRLFIITECLKVVVMLCDCFNSSLPGQNDHHFTNDIFKCIFFNENVSIAFTISLKFVRKGPITKIRHYPN